MLLSFGAAKTATTAAGARNLRIGATLFEGGAGLTRGVQGVYSLQQGRGAEAAGYFGEAMLRFIGVGASTIAELKAAQAARAARAAANVPFGFVTQEEFANFGTKLASILKAGGVTDAKAFLQGSAVTGVRRYAKPGVPAGTPFDAIKKSDFDIAIISPQLFEKAKSWNIPIRQGSRTVPLREGNFKQLGLFSACQWSSLTNAQRNLCQH